MKTRISICYVLGCLVAGGMLSGCHKSAFGVRGMSGLGEVMTQRKGGRNLAQEELLEIVDAHMFFEFPSDPIATQPTTGMEIEFEGARILGAVIHRVSDDFPPKIRRMKQRFSVCGFISTEPALNRLESGLRKGWYRCLRVRLHPGVNLFGAAETGAYALAAKYGVPVVFSYEAPQFDRIRRDSQFLSQMRRLPANYPETRFVFSHLGRPYSTELLELMNTYQNVYTDTAALVPGDVSILRRTTLLEEVLTPIERFVRFPDRLIYGSGWPGTLSATYVSLVRSVIPRRHWRKVFYGNAVRLFRMDLDPKREISSQPASAKPLIEIKKPRQQPQKVN